MKTCDFDFGRFREWRAQREEAMRRFLSNDGAAGNVMLLEKAGSRYVICRTPQESLECQLDALTRQMDFKTGYVPFLEPWFGVGVFANAFGCEYVWVENQSPQTHYLIHTAEQAAKLTRPSIGDSPVMKLVLDAIDYFVEQTRGEIPISCTDTQSPFDTATLIWDTASFFSSLCVAPEAAHHVLGLITEVVIEFTREQIKHLGGTWARPGHIMPSAVGAPGFSVSDDNIVMVGPDQYAEFAVPYNEAISDAFGGLAVHSCGNFERQLPALMATRGLMMADGAFSRPLDPTPNLNFERFRDLMKGTGVILQVRAHQDWPDILRRLYHRDMRIALVVPPPAPDEPIDKNRVAFDRIMSQIA